MPRFPIVHDGDQTMIIYPHYDQVDSDDWMWANFTPKELACRHCNRLILIPEFMDALQGIRGKCGFPFPISSGYRCRKHDKAVGGGGAHTTGRAVDIRVHGFQAQRIMETHLSYGFTGIGLKLHGPHKERFVHIDALSQAMIEEINPRATRPVSWTYR